MDSTACVVVVTENNRIIFDVGEGSQRLCVEHGIRLGKVNGIFISRCHLDTIGGLPGEKCFIHAYLWEFMVYFGIPMLFVQDSA